MREIEGEGELPGSEHPVIAVVRVGLIGAFGGTECVGNVPIGLCRGSQPQTRIIANENIDVKFKEKKRGHYAYTEQKRIRVADWIVVNCPCV